MNQHFRIAFDTLIKLLVCLRRFVNTDLVRDHEGRVGAAGDDHIAEVAVILLDVALTRSKSEALRITSSQLKTTTRKQESIEACIRRPMIEG